MKIETATEQPFKQMTRQMNKLLDQLQKGYYNFLPSETWAPNVNLYETESAYLVCVDLAGVDKSKIDLTVEDNILTLRGNRTVPAPEEPAAESAEADEPHGKRIKVHLMEIDHGCFCREVELPHGVHREQITASYRNGMLWIEAPKK